MSTVISIVSGCVVGITLGTAGVGLSHWQFWVIILTVGVLNSIIAAKR